MSRRMPCGMCQVCLYAYEVSEPSQRWSRLSKLDRERFMPKCKSEPTKNCSGAEDLHLALIAKG